MPNAALARRLPLLLALTATSALVSPDIARAADCGQYTRTFGIFGIDIEVQAANSENRHAFLPVLSPFFFINQGKKGHDGSSGGIFHSGHPGGPGKPGLSLRLKNCGTLTSKWPLTPAMLARSTGGNGGDGGGGGWFDGRGGGGGNGGNGGNIIIANQETGTITTSGFLSPGIGAFSRGGTGGGGGNGSWWYHGGTGAIGGNGGTIDIDNEADIATRGHLSHGILARSEGGYAGDGGDGGFIFGNGGDGGKGGNSGSKVTAENSGHISTSGGGASGIVLQSVGGKGGKGGSASSLLVAIGASGGIGGSAGAVTATNDGGIATAGGDAKGISVQSVGGGGGDGGDAKNASALGGVAIGGSGGGGGLGGPATVTNAADITTSGGHAHAIMAQSVGGGGGDGGGADGITAGPGAAVQVSIGGSGGKGGHAGDVAVSAAAGHMIATGASDAGATADGTGGRPGDHAKGILAQSVGGGGGIGGRAVAAAASGSESASLSVSVGLGGKGGSGGHGDTVTVDSATDISTAGRHADAILAQSVGGGGGAGGNAVTTSASISSTSGSVSVGIGGAGGSGGAGGDVSITSAGALSTRETLARGIVGQSIGGGGGSGGSVIDVAASAGHNAMSVSVGVGGSGGDGGEAGSATVTAAEGGSIATQGHRAHALVAQSIGGGGGNGGNVHTYAVAGASGSPDGSLAASASVGVGGSGGKGGHGAAATAHQDGAISTSGDNAYGALVQSIGGGGGDGGNVFALSAAVSLSTSGPDGASSGGRAMTASVGVGGSGGDGGSAGAATYTAGSGSAIQTSGVRSVGVLAQSIGGGGGTGGHAHTFAAGTATNSARTEAQQLLDKIASGGSDPAGFTGTVTVGGRGGAGNTGGDVSVTLDTASRIATSGAQSHGVHAQSVGGGGGAGGYAFADGFAGNRSYGLTLAIGGQGGTGGDGKKVTVASDGDAAGDHSGIATGGDFAHGILAHSVGGGGGEGGAAKSNLWTVPTKSGTSLSISLGGAGGASGGGGEVEVDHSAPIGTRGEHAVGILAQSVGGGGGIGGGSHANGLLSFGLGASGGAGGDAGSIAVKGAADIVTAGIGGHGVVAQSIGGGGGIGANAAGTAFTRDVGLNAHIGGDGGDGGKGGAVTVTRGGGITTHGDTAFGILAQSVGGGGGIAAIGSMTPGVADRPFDIATDGDAGAGGDVTVGAAENGLDVTTYGDGAHAIFAQSIGGGGGLIQVAHTLADLGIDHTATGHEVASAGDVSVTTNGTVATDGDHAYGIFAQSLQNTLTVTGTDGFDTFSGFSGVQSGRVTVAQAGSIATSGAGSHGILVQTTNDSADHAIDVLLSGAVSVSGQDAWGLFSQNGTADGVHTDEEEMEVKVHGKNLDKPKLPPGIWTPPDEIVVEPIRTTVVDIEAGATLTAGGSAKGALKIDDWLGPVTVTVDGAIDAGTGRAVQVNGYADLGVSGSGAVTGDIISVGSWPLHVTNAGTITGGTSNVASYTLSDGGQHRLRIARDGSRSDTLSLHTLTVDGGTILPVLTGLPSGDFRETTIIASGETLALGNALLPGSLSSRFTYAIGTHTVAVTGASVDFTRAGLAGTDGQLATLATRQLSGWAGETGPGAAYAPLHDLLLGAANATTQDQLSHSLEALNATAHYADLESSMTASGTHLTNMQSCGDTSGPYAAIAETECHWAKVAYHTIRQTDGDRSHDATTFSFGRQAEFRYDVYLGLSAAYQATGFESPTSTSDGHRVHAGAIAKLSRGPWYGSASITASYGWGEGRRSIALPGGAVAAWSEHEAAAIATRLRGAYLFEIGGLDLMPLVELDLAAIHDRGYREQGAGALNLEVGSDTHFLVDLHPAIRLGGAADFDDVVLRGYAEIGARTALNDPSVEISLPHSPLPGETVRLDIDREDVLGTLAAGASVHWGGRFELRMRYEAGFGRDTRSHAGSVKLGVKF